MVWPILIMKLVNNSSFLLKKNRQNKWRIQGQDSTSFYQKVSLIKFHLYPFILAIYSAFFYIPLKPYENEI